MTAAGPLLLFAMCAGMVVFLLPAALYFAVVVGALALLHLLLNEALRRGKLRGAVHLWLSMAFIAGSAALFALAWEIDTRGSFGGSTSPAGLSAQRP